MKKLVLASLLAGAAALPGTANAAITVYTTQASYLAAISNPGVDTYNNLSANVFTSSPLNRTAGAYGYRAAATGGFVPAGTNADEWLATNIATDAITFSNFTGGVYGFGGNFFDSNVSGNFLSGNVVVSVSDAAGAVTQTIVNATTSSFLGFVSTTGITGATVSAVQQGQGGFRWATVNNLTLGGAAAVPEPATWAMMIVGLGIVGASLRRTRKTPQVRFNFA